MKLKVEEVYKTEGTPEYTFVSPPNFNEILVDLRNPRKPVVVEGQSGTGKTTTVRRILETETNVAGYVYLSARKASDMERILQLGDGRLLGAFIVDDFHRLNVNIQQAFADLVKVAAEDPEQEKYPKIVIVGINKVGSGLIQLVHDVAKRCGIHRIAPADSPTTLELIDKGEVKLLIEIENKQSIADESKGDYWLTQLICQTICLINDVTETQTIQRKVGFDLEKLRKRVIARLEHTYAEPIKEFCRGRRFRSTNDPYLKLLKCVSEQESSIVDLTELANFYPEVRGSINNIKEKRLTTLIENKPLCEQYFYYNQETKKFAIEDPALFYYLKHLNWEQLRQECGFRTTDQNYEFDFAISFAGENRELARLVTSQLELLDCSVFFDELFEANFLGKAWRKEFKTTFKDKARFVVCLLDKFYEEKIWPTFERECFTPRIADEAVIPIYLDDTIFVAIPQDTIGIHFHPNDSTELVTNEVADQIVFKLYDRLQHI